MRLLGILITFLLTITPSYSSPSIDFSGIAGVVDPNTLQQLFLNINFPGVAETLVKPAFDSSPDFTFLSFTYLYVALIGFYIAIILHFNKKVESTAKILISAFIFIHSIFILHIFLSITKYQFQFPHTYRLSTVFSFLYGPLLYLYFKRITQQHRFKKIDLLHFLPTLIFAIYLFPGYLMSADEKLEIMLGRANIGRSFSDVSIIVLKLLSLLIYGYFIRRMYMASKKNIQLDRENKIWQKNIFIIHMLYVVCYSVYGTLLANNINFGVLYHIQVVCMASMVMYLGYSANVQPGVFNGSFSFNKLLFKYKKSGLTKSLSLELKENLIYLFDKEKIYKESNLCLDTLSDKLNTTRHNASQVINEHFKMSFHELINTYRIQEAKAILNSDIKKNLNIIDVAYEVGYNNKVTFNKAFKKDTQLTPSQYQRIAITT
ncbi:AraC family transcriptional regulator [Maribacter algarum]|uniref:AraC family transcriptional regulator n=1 Tax=Maribacter algarum (ex Zhang et al. 2020) TaxID=2578118 RepID=A0A5S3PG84_9FLAO|nr:helix-turn-helix domain-containing protein [Maribacter algarum]TMM53150.1 AraC family transcriptional regulator [Maribacter algarum]